jgi:hypothetical protein
MACTTIGFDRVEVIDQGGHWLHNTTTWPCIKVQLKLRTGRLKQNIGILRNRERFSNDRSSIHYSILAVIRRPKRLSSCNSYNAIILYLSSTDMY